jgi:hypothetical protein
LDGLDRKAAYSGTKKKSILSVTPGQAFLREPSDPPEYHHVPLLCDSSVSVPSDIFLATTTKGGWGKLINSVALGCTLVILPFFDAQETMRMVEREKVTILTSSHHREAHSSSPDLAAYDTHSLKMF